MFSLLFEKKKERMVALCYHTPKHIRGGWSQMRYSAHLLLESKSIMVHYLGREILWRSAECAGACSKEHLLLTQAKVSNLDMAVFVQ
jgi:hypothetical protein